MKKLEFKFIKNIKLKKGGHFFGFGLSPYSDWRIILTASVILCLMIIGISAKVFYGVRKPQTTQDVSTDLVPLVFDEEKLMKTIEYYQNKQQVFNSINLKSQTIIDPSL